MNKKNEVTYNPQLGYLKSIFDHDYDYLSGIKNYKAVLGGVEFEVNTIKNRVVPVKITVISPQVVRFQLFPEGEEKIHPNSIINPPERSEVSVFEEDNKLVISAEELRIELLKYPWEMSLYYQGKLMTRQQIRDSNVDNMCKYIPTGFDYDGEGKVAKVYERMNLFSDEYFYGFGEKFTDFNKRGQKITSWQVDALSTNSEASYKNIPFFMSSRGYGILLNSFSKAVFDMGQTSGVSYSMEVEDNYIDYIWIAGPDYKEILNRYTNITGKSPLIPKWAFGLWMSKCSYRTQEEVETVAKMLREHDIPCDVIHIDGWMRRSSGGDWTWDLERFPNPRGMIAALKEYGIKLSLWIWPYIPHGCEKYEEALSKGYLVMTSKGTPALFHPTAAKDRTVAAFDFTNPSMREWYKVMVKNIVKDGVGAIKTDFSEALPADAVYFDGTNGIQGHNQYPFLYNKTIYEAVKEVKDAQGEKPLLWSRSGYAGSQKYPAHWGGDSSSHTNNLASMLRGGLSIGLSGISYWAHDIGGFYNTDHEGYEIPPSVEEYLKSAAFGLLSPLSRCHGKTPREPWNFGVEAENVFRRFAKLRYELVPYLYQAAYESHEKGIPMLRPLFLEFPQDPTTYHVELQYMLGESLMVVPVFDQEKVSFYLPEGLWINWWNGENISGPCWVKADLEMNRIPVFIRENCVIPTASHDMTHICESSFDTLNAVISIGNKVSFQYKDEDFKKNLQAFLRDEELQIDTDLNLESLKVYCSGNVKKLKVNGDYVDFKIDEDKSITVPLSN
jgi:alpha-D-xyloside xylohydrolase